MSALRRLVMPKLGLTMTEGTVAEWQAGQSPAASPQPAPEAAPSAAQARRWRKASAFELAAARRLSESKQQIPHFYLCAEIEASRLQALRERGNAEPARPRITLTHLIVAAVARVLVRHPEVNRTWQDDGFVDLDSIDVGVAVHTRQGLVAPVLRGADRKNLADLARDIGILVERARAAALAPEDVGGGAITVSNAGMHDVTYMASIINPGQSAILGIGSERRVFRPDAQGAPRLARELGVVLSCDHRMLDGVRALAFLNEFRAVLEAPEPLFD